MRKRYDFSKGVRGKYAHRSSRFPDGWDAERIARVLEHYETQGDEEAVAEDESDGQAEEMEAEGAQVD